MFIILKWYVLVHKIIETITISEQIMTCLSKKQSLNSLVQIECFYYIVQNDNFWIKGKCTSNLIMHYTNVIDKRNVPLEQEGPVYPGAQ